MLGTLSLSSNSPGYLPLNWSTTRRTASADVFLLEHCKSLRSDLKSSATQLYRGAKQYMKTGNNTSVKYQKVVRTPPQGGPE